MRTTILKRIFQVSLVFYFSTVIFTRFANQTRVDPLSRVLLSFPLVEYLQTTKNVKMQICPLTAQEVADLLKTNPDHFENCFDGNTLKNVIPKEYVVIRLLDNGGSTFGDLKCYFSCFAFPIGFHVSVDFTPIIKPKLLMYSGPGYENIILPFPASCDHLKPCTISLSWKSSNRTN